jgi:glycosyltransferase involved in cell wall biosynthesis
MKIGIEGQRLFRAKKHGMDMVALELINNLQKIDNQNEYIVYVNPDEDKDCLKETDNFKIVELEGGSYPNWEQRALPKAALKDGCDILHCTSNTAPIRSKVPLVVTLHDIIYMEKNPLTQKGFTTYQKFGNFYRRFVVPRIIKKSKRIITVSNYEKNRIAEFFGLKDKRLVAIYNGVSEHFIKTENQEWLNQMKTKYELPNKFLFFIGNTDPKKNTPGVLKAFSSFIKQSEEKIPLVMPDYNRDHLNAILEQIGDKDLINHIHLTGYIDNKELPAIYNLCEIFLYPSNRESFGIPMLEAMRCGVPVITSNTSSMPEVSGGAAYIVNPAEPEEITNGIFTLLKDDKMRAELVSKGYENAKKFSWENMAKDVLSLYNNVYQENN